MATYARHQGTCGRCQRPINVGDPIAKADRVIGWLHEDCAAMSDEAEEIPASDFADRYRTGPADR